MVRKKGGKGWVPCPSFPDSRSVPTARESLPASAALGGFSLGHIFGHGFLQALAGRILVLAFFGAHGTVLGSASATARGFLNFTDAPGVRFGPSTTAGRMRAGQTHAAGSNQAGNAETGEQFFQILAFHDTSFTG